MTNKVENDFTRDKDLIARHRKQKIKVIIVSLALTISFYLLYAGVSDNFRWTMFVFILIGESILVLFKMNEKALVDIRWNKDESKLAVTYFRLRDNIISEIVSIEYIESIKNKGRQNKVVLRLLLDKRTLKLTYGKKNRPKFENYKTPLLVSKLF